MGNIMGNQEPLQSSPLGPLDHGDEALGRLHAQLKALQSPDTAAAATQPCQPCGLQKEIDELKSSQSQQVKVTQARDVLISEIMATIAQQKPGFDQNKAQAPPTVELLPWEIEGLSAAEKAGLKMQHDQGIRAEQRAKDNDDMLMKNWDEIRAVVSAVNGQQQPDLIKEWWDQEWNYDITTIDGQVNMFGLTV